MQSHALLEDGIRHAGEKISQVQDVFENQCMIHGAPFEVSSIGKNLLIQLSFEDIE